MHGAAAASKHESPAFGRPTVDEVAAGVAALRDRLAGRAVVPPAELRRIWQDRLRPFWRLHPELYRAMARRFLDHGENYLAIAAAEEATALFPPDAALLLTQALAIARSGAPAAAQELLTRHHAILEGAPEARSLLARTFKDLWKASGDERHLRRAFELYAEDYARTSGDRTFPGVNAAAMAFLLGDRATAARLAGEVRRALDAAPPPLDYWGSVTRAECLLIAGDVSGAHAAYVAATGAGAIPPAHLATTRAQARLLLRAAGRDEGEFDGCFPVPEVLVFTGHRLDLSTRPSPRFPAGMAPAVKARIHQAILKSDAGHGYAAAANGGDILFLECMQEAGRDTSILLPLPEEDFLRASVADAPGWVERFVAVKARAAHFEVAAASAPGAVAFDYGNRRLLGAACQRARQIGSTARLLALWNGNPGTPGDGGTGDCVRLAREAGIAVEVIALEPFQGPPSSRAGIDLSRSERVLALVTLHLADGSAKAVADQLAEAPTLHREVFGTRVRLLFESIEEAARAARRLRACGPLVGAIGLHAGPVRFDVHPLTGAREPRGAHLEPADALAELEPTDAIYASGAFVALGELEPTADLRAEFLGHRQLGLRNEGPVFRLGR